VRAIGAFGVDGDGMGDLAGHELHRANLASVQTRIGSVAAIAVSTAAVDDAGVAEHGESAARVPANRAGVVVEAGETLLHLVGKNVAVMGGGMVTRYRKVPISDALPLPHGVPVEAGAAVLINPLTALAMLETLRKEGHTALVHTAAASSLGQMLNRICLEDGVGLVNVVRRSEHVELLRRQGARYVCDSSSPDFVAELNAQVAETGATLAFDAVGGGRLASQILSAMERHAQTRLQGYNRYGAKTRKQVYVYGGLDARPSELDLRAYGMSWSVGGWLIFDELAQNGRIAMPLQETVWASRYGALVDKFGIAWTVVPQASKVSGIKPIALASADGGRYVMPSRESFQKRDYPLVRSIYIYLNRVPGQPVEPRFKEFLRYILSRQGQQRLAENGNYLPLTASVVREQLRALD